MSTATHFLRLPWAEGWAERGNDSDVVCGFNFFSAGSKLLQAKDSLLRDFIWPVPSIEPGAP